MTGDCGFDNTYTDDLGGFGKDTVCVGVSCSHTPNTLDVGVCHAIVAFREDPVVVSSRVGQMGNVLVLRPFVRTRLPMSDIDTLSPCSPGCH